MIRTLACLAAAMTTTAVVLGWLEPRSNPTSLDAQTIVAKARQAVADAGLFDYSQWDDVAIVASSEPSGLLAAKTTSNVAHFRIAANGLPTNTNSWLIAPSSAAADEPRTIRIEVPQRRRGEPMTLAQWISVRALVLALQNSRIQESELPLPVRFNQEWAVVYGHSTDFSDSDRNSS